MLKMSELPPDVTVENIYKSNSDETIWKASKPGSNRNLYPEHIFIFVHAKMIQFY